MSVPPDDVLLCERCGYVLEGLPVEGKCPECGRAISTSLWSNRCGNAWERNPTRKNWIASVKQLLLTPTRAFAELRGERAPMFASLNAWCAGASLSLVPSLAAGFGLLLGSNVIIQQSLAVSGLVAVVGGLLIGAASGMLVWGVSTVLCWIARMLVVIAARACRWRMSGDLIASICDHATAGWLIGPLVCFALWLAGVPTLIAIAIGLAIAPLGFVYLLLLGVHACRFANEPRTVQSRSTPLAERALA